MKTKLLLTMGSLLSCTMMIHAQTKTDSIAGTYTRDYHPPVDTSTSTTPVISPYVWTWYQPYRKHEDLLLERNHCAALTTDQTGGLVVTLGGNPYTYYGIWRISGDTVTITYSRSYSMNEYIVYVSEPSSCNAADTSHYTPPPPAPAPIRKISPVIIEKFLWHDGNILTPINNSDGDFTKMIFLTAPMININYLP